MGEIKNIGSTSTTYVKVIATAYNSTGHIVDYSFTYAVSTDELAVNGIPPFECIILSDRAVV